MDCFGYEICDKLIWAPGKICRNTNTTSKQGIPEINTKITSTSETLCFGCYTHKGSYDILSENLVSQRLQAYSSIYEGDLLRYANKAKSRHVIGIPTTCGYQHYGQKVLMLEICLLNLILHFQWITTHCIIFAWKFYHFTCLSILEGYIVNITNYDYNKYLSISA